jgi:hypothetical protein
MIFLELSFTSHIWVILSFEIARGEGIEGKGKREGKREKICPSPQPFTIFFAVAI